VKLLALDTSSVACTVAVQNGEQVFTRHVEQPREHTRLLMPMIRSVLADADLGLCDLDGIVLGNGPGSFIGMRIAAAVAQGLAFGAGLKIAPVSSLAAVAAEVGSSGPAHVAVAQDAHMQEVYLGLYELNDGTVSATVPERLQRCEVIAELGDRDDYVAAGYGWQRFPALLAANRANLQGDAEVLYPHARFLLKLGMSAFGRGEAVAAEDVIPAYLRQKVAEKPHRKVR
jgi:tRNA threonylcarbamoyladenosine biosynthesis protein TsaB